MARSALFEPMQIRGLSLNNRIVIAPMCQYSAEDGCMNEWHLIHLGKLALSGAALLTIEATAVVPEGRITYADLGLWNDQTHRAMSLTLESIRRWSDIPIGIQLSHAGRKASTEVPWKGGGQFSPADALGWQTFAPSSIAYSAGMPEPRSLDKEGLKRVRDAFVSASARAAKMGIDFVQLHAAHGYLLHQFLSPLTNHRTDEYGGSLKNRMRFPLEVFDAVRSAFPAERPVSARVSATDWIEGGWDIEQTLAFAHELEGRGCDIIHVSSGGLHPDQKIAVGPGYQVPFARAVKSVVRIPVVAVGLITGFDQAEAIVGTGDADMVALARAILFDPNWPWHAAAHLGGKVRVPKQYRRSAPSRFKDLFEAE
ncbi:NADH:flavin oxidoreductase/NADH oxidase [Rhizobium sp. BK251]|uniref:NADH:flavin oxidoreductase/NADH oxidase n=1 Tax=Rhizobium sp. BK251 TaxID=2512125 RepID=UPI001046A129|nr:NADH:flavin oxidoreductase/NADH oxidase [Rhizobium sp. BK251]TCL67168.1 2,4-dienoyl-CoA reductase-like NADH-dependent reductase (Old Yellow Enzyme family) [Rhizobium sp. BK251]